MPIARKTRQPRRTQTDQLMATQNQILEYLRQDVEEWKKTGDRYDRQQRATLQALAAISKSLASISESQATISESQATISESQATISESQATVSKSLAAIDASQARQVETLRDIHAITTRVLEQSNHVMLQLGASGATH
jgi:chromosome segregation ATPase